MTAETSLGAIPVGPGWEGFVLGEISAQRGWFGITLLWSLWLVR